MGNPTRVLILRPEGQSEELASMLMEQGLEVANVAAIEIVPLENVSELDAALAGADSFDLVVFTSVNGVAAALDRMRSSGSDPSKLSGRAAAIGPATAAALEAAGITVAWMPSRFTTDAMADEMPDAYKRVLLVRADIASTELEDRLRARGIDVARVNAYGTREANHALIREEMGRGIDVALVTSASVARSFAAATKGMPLPPVLSIGPATTAACREEGIEPASEAYEHTIGGLVGCLERYLRD